MYEAFFNLRKKPFELIPDPDFIYLSRSHKKAITYLDYGIRERVGFILLTGEVGSGKTTIIRDLLKNNYDRVVLAKIFNTRVNSEQLLAMINDDFGLSVVGKDKITLIRDLNDFLLEQYAAGNYPMLIIDEAQNLASDLLEEVRMLSNLESAHGKLLQIVLVGQPELRDTLAAPELLQLRQRISINCHLKALSLEEMSEYILHRMTVAGNRDALVFPSGTLELIYQYSRGIPRLVNIICDFLMLSAFAEETGVASLEMARDVLGDLDFEQHFWGDRKTGSRPQDADPAQNGEATAMATADRLTLVLDELSGTLSLLRRDFNDHVSRVDAEVAELGRSVGNLGTALERIGQQALQESPADAGLVRRLFGSNAANGKK